MKDGHDNNLQVLGGYGHQGDKVAYNMEEDGMLISSQLISILKESQSRSTQVLWIGGLDLIWFSTGFP